MDSFLLKYIAQRMQEMGHSSFHFEPVRITDISNWTFIPAYNEYYYLVSKTVPATLEIVSDTNIFNEGASYNNFTYYGIQEFSGMIEISQAAAGIDLEFIKVSLQVV